MEGSYGGTSGFLLFNCFSITLVIKRSLLVGAAVKPIKIQLKI